LYRRRHRTRDVNNGIARRAWAQNNNANFAIKRAMELEPRLVVTLPNDADAALIDAAIDGN
jgi:urocanate hydratase